MYFHPCIDSSEHKMWLQKYWEGPLKFNKYNEEYAFKCDFEKGEVHLRSFLLVFFNDPPVSMGNPNDWFYCQVADLKRELGTFFEGHKGKKNAENKKTLELIDFGILSDAIVEGGLALNKRCMEKIQKKRKENEDRFKKQEEDYKKIEDEYQKLAEQLQEVIDGVEKQQQAKRQKISQ